MENKGKWTVGALALLLIMAEGFAAAPPPREDCSAPPEFTQSKLVLVGELHGTQQAPAFIGSAACALAAQGSLVVGLEMPAAEQPRIDAYLGSGGGSKERAALTIGEFWGFQDGRASHAMLDLNERLRVLKRGGAPLQVLAMDGSTTNSSKSEAMAVALRRAMQGNPQARVLALMGNIHARVLPDEAEDDPPVGSRLRDLRPLAVLAGYGEGEAWVCMDDFCGVHPMSSRWGKGRKHGYYPGQAAWSSYADTIHLGTITASLPVRGAATKQNQQPWAGK